MFGSIVLDVVIGLALMFCMYSLLVTIVNELIASMLGLRAKKLELAIWRMLTDNDGASAKFGNIFKSAWSFVTRGKFRSAHPSNKLFKTFYSQPLITYMSARKGKKPSFISSKNFCKALLDGIKELGEIKASTTPESIRKALKTVENKAHLKDTVRLIESFLEDANNDLEKFRAHIERWFDDTTERAVGWYKRQTQLITFVLGIIVAVLFNVNAIEIAKILSKDKDAREQMVALAQSYSQKEHPAPDAAPSVSGINSIFDSAQNLIDSDIKDANYILGLGWGRGGYNFDVNKIYNVPRLIQSKKFQLSLAGWLITALAISLGAPFWFDLLGKLVQIKGAGIKPKAASKPKEEKE